MAENLLEELTRRIGVTTLDYLEKMAAAYLLETNLKPSEVELVMQFDGRVYRWYFRKRTEIQPAEGMEYLEDDE